MPKIFKAKKLVSISATFMLVTGASKVTPVIQTTQKVILDWVSCIHYLVQFWKDKRATIRAVIDFGSEVNVMTLAYAKKLGIQIQRTNVSA